MVILAVGVDWVSKMTRRVRLSWVCCRLSRRERNGEGSGKFEKKDGVNDFWWSGVVGEFPGSGRNLLIGKIVP